MEKQNPLKGKVNSVETRDEVVPGCKSSENTSHIEEKAEGKAPAKVNHSARSSKSTKEVVGGKIDPKETQESLPKSRVLESAPGPDETIDVAPAKESVFQLAVVTAQRKTSLALSSSESLISHNAFMALQNESEESAEEPELDEMGNHEVLGRDLILHKPSRPHTKSASPSSSSSSGKQRKRKKRKRSDQQSPAHGGGPPLLLEDCHHN
ncbi:unnamed protein product [Microthlaspi erraticum]|uniref:Uncharacterized protein n=1 Tax=Microthlaspi erraticum TaxID=1685480 RepID=A0A6D2IMP8_9BRAS|nr:unnamed protein product [Microthlaspi erraticum]